MKPWLWLPSKLSHDLAPYALHALTLSMKSEPTIWRPFEWNSIKFQNRLGLAGGVDKTGQSLSSWWKLGIGFAEVGTVTPLPQGPNPGKIMDRNITHQALWNKMGFPNAGMQVLKKKLSTLPRPFPTPLFVNVGRNRTTSNEDASKDYLSCMENLSEFADAFVINISSPNTSGLRELHSPEKLRHFLEPLANFKSQNNGKPMLLKISPDLETEDLNNLMQTSVEHDIDGWIISNTTLYRPNNLSFSNEGGLSGQPLSSISKQILQNALEILGEKRKGKLIISAGGVLNENDVLERLEIGADLVQTYSGIVFEGPFFFKKCLKRLQEIDS